MSSVGRLPLYEPPTDGPLDEIQQAIVRALVPIIVRKIREEQATVPARRFLDEPQKARRARYRQTTKAAGS